MTYLVLFVLEVILIYLTSKKVVRLLAGILINIFKNRQVSTYIFSLLYLPGTLFHELSHYITAKILRVPVGGFTIKPQIEGRSIKLGSVSVGKSDLIRYTLVGVAPFFTGTALVVLMFANASVNQIFEYNFLTRLLSFYIVFEIANTMFLSKSDIRGLVRITFVIVLIIFFLILLFKIDITDIVSSLLVNNNIVKIYKLLSYYLIIPVAINMAIMLMGKVFGSILKR